MPPRRAATAWISCRSRGGTKNRQRGRTRMLSSHFAIVSTLGVCLIAGPRPAAAQVQRGAISGTALDKTRAVLPGVVLTLTSDVAAPRETTTAGRGEFRFSDLDPGVYTVRAELAGFAPL